MFGALTSLTGGGGMQGGDTSSGTGPQSGSAAFTNSLLNQIGGFTKAGIVFGASGRSRGGVSGSSASASTTQDTDQDGGRASTGAANNSPLLYAALGLSALTLVVLVARR